jgi:hypothetical protein
MKSRNNTISRAPPPLPRLTSEVAQAQYGFYASMWRRWPFSSTAPEHSTALMSRSKENRARYALSPDSTLNTTPTGHDRIKRQLSVKSRRNVLRDAPRSTDRFRLDATSSSTDTLIFPLLKHVPRI